MADLIIIEDTREQKPLKFNKSYIDMVVSEKLDYGDYSCHCDGQICPIFFDRKSIGDLFGTLSRKKNKKTGESRADVFKREIKRCNDNKHLLVIIIEVSFTDILKGYKHSQIDGLTIIRTLFTFMFRHRVLFLPCTSRREMANYISEFYRSYFNNKGD